ncbi:pirin family protein [Flavobacteriaceae bacterium TP-CH-4]|uniref:Pirin family protein n=1 Tax=Pelagihabitans pacificus TaxID=2696054 RepID=A0A967AVJ8_9FLAO|nr:pirin family protein [Pelagihabitans pacificus]NHF59863.1 pirin family protein [Pelagihabitans pacificus]
MSNIGLIIEERSRDIGDFLVGRLIPFRKKRMIGPFIFIDHMGPTVLGPTTYMDVDQHPHIGLATLTYMLEGELMHADSMGTQQRIAPGSVNWMVAGKGVSHTERTPDDWRHGKQFTAHGYQIWVALPKDKEDIDPEFHHIPGHELPMWEDGPASFKLVAGEGYGRKSPVPIYSPLFMIEIKTTDEYLLDTKAHLKGEIGLCIVEGAIEACGEIVEKGHIVVSKVSDTCKTTLRPNTHLLLFGGASLPEERHIYWNFVSHDQKKIERAKTEWAAKTFPMMDDDHSYVPLPGR